MELPHALAVSLGPKIRKGISPGWIDVSNNASKGGPPKRFSALKTTHSIRPVGSPFFSQTLSMDFSPVKASSSTAA